MSTFAPPTGIIRKGYGALNVALAKKPKFAIIGTGRCGTSHVTDLFKANGIYCSHESYFTPEGPMLKNPRRRFTAKGDASWLAVPFLPDPDILVAHQVRSPMKVIKSFYNIGFFDPAHDARRLTYVAFAKRYFEWSDDPLRSCVRWYIEWNERCEAITPNRYRVEDVDLKQLGEWLDLKLEKEAINKTKNSRTRKVDIPFDEEAVKEVPEYPKLLEMASRYGY